MSKCYYLKLPNGEKIPVFSNNECYPLEKPKFCDQFIELWNLLFNVGLANGPNFSNIIDSFPMPISLSSTLVGVPFITDPTSIVRLFSFTNSNLDGPIVTEGYNLQTYNDSVFYEIEWSIRDDFDDFTIGFYRSDGFAEDVTNTFSLICGNRGASIFNKTSGKIISQGFSNLFVATNRDTIIDLKVRVIIPDKIVYPQISPDKPYEKFITIRDRCGNKHKILVYTISFTDDTGFTVMKCPSKYFIEATRVIQDFLVVTGLSVTLMRSTDSKNLLLVCNDCVGPIGCGVNDIGTIEYLNNFLFGSNASTNASTTCNPQYWTGLYYYGIKLNTPSGKVPRITFEITTTDGGEYLFHDYTVTVKIQYRSGLLWFTHNSLDNDGNINGDAETPPEQFVSEGFPVTFSGNFRIPETSTAFCITVYYGMLINQLLANELMKNTRFQKIAIQYEDKVITSR